MIENIEDSFLDNVDKNQSKNDQQNVRVKLYENITKYYDNFCRTSFKKMIPDYFQYLVMYVFITLYYYNIYHFNAFSFMDNINLMIEEIHILSMNLLNIFLDSWASRINTFIETLEINQKLDLSFYPLEKMNLSEKYDIPMDFLIILFMYNVLIGSYFLIRLYGFQSQKILFNSTILNYYIPIFFLWNFKQRNKSKSINVRLIRHQKNKAIMSNNAKTIISNIFDLDQNSLTKKDNIEIILKPKTLLYFYDYYELSYSINDTNVKNKIMEEIEEIKQRQDDSNNSELENINLYMLEDLELD